MSYKNNLRQISNIIYRLKRTHGLEMVVWHPESTTHDIESGAIVRSYATTYIRRGIMLPPKLARSFVYDLSYIAANKNFTYGALFDISRRFVLIDAKDTGDFEFTPQDYIVFQNRFYNIVQVNEAEDLNAWMLLVKEISATDHPSPYTVGMTDTAIPLQPHIQSKYYTNGVYNGQTAYQSMRGNYWLWFNGLAWRISTVKGSATVDFENQIDSNIIGTYEPSDVLSGTATVTAN